MCIEIHIYNANELITATQVEPLEGSLPSACFNFRSQIDGNDTDKFAGAGLYACFYDNKLVYIGKYRGLKNDWTSGNVVDQRWIKHIGTFTLLTRRIGFSKKAYTQIVGYMVKGEHRHMFDEEPLSNLRKEFIKTKDNPAVLHRNKGCMSTLARFKVVKDLWLEQPHKLKPWLKKFEFLYVKFSKDTELSTAQVRQIVSDAENAVLAVIHPPGNTISGRRITELPNSKILEDRFRKALIDSKDTYLGEKTEKSTTNQTNYQANTSSEPEDDEESSSVLFERKIESAPAFAKALVDGVHQHFENYENVFVEYTGKKHPEMRLRLILPAGEKFRNFATFEWQTRKKRFLMRTNLSDAKLKSHGFSRSTYHKKTLPCVTYIDEETLQRADLNSLYCLLEDCLLAISAAQHHK